VNLSDLVKYSITQSIVRSFCAELLVETNLLYVTEYNPNTNPEKPHGKTPRKHASMLTAADIE